jgi:hypothetical protein
MIDESLFGACHNVPDETHGHVGIDDWHSKTKVGANELIVTNRKRVMYCGLDDNFS